MVEVSSELFRDGCSGTGGEDVRLRWIGHMSDLLGVI